MDRKSRKSAPADNIAAVNTGAMKRRRYTMTVIAIIAVLAIFAAFTFAWFTGISRNRDNQITAGSVALQLLTTSPTNTIGSVDGAITGAAALPAYDGAVTAEELLYKYKWPASGGEQKDLVRDVVTLDDNDNTLTKFLETVERDENGKVTATSHEILAQLPNFRQQRPIIVYNPSSAPAEYTIDFITHEIDKDVKDPQAALDTAYYFNYTRLYDVTKAEKGADDVITVNTYDIPANKVLADKWGDITGTNDASLAADTATTQKNIATSINPISGKTYDSTLDAASDVVEIGANSVHIYMVDMGITYTAGNSYQASDLSIDIVLTTGQTGDTIILTDDITVNKDITPRYADAGDGYAEGDIKPGIFNLILNGYTLAFENGTAADTGNVDTTKGLQGMLQVKFPNEAAAKATVQTMDIGSPDGGKIVGVDRIQIIANDKDGGTFCGVNWYTDVTGKALVLTDEYNIDTASDDNNVTVDTVLPANAAAEADKLSGKIIVDGTENKVVVTQRTASSFAASRYDEWALLKIDDITLASMASSPILASGAAGDINNPYEITTKEQFKFVVEALNGDVDGVTIGNNTYFVIKGSIGDIKHVPAIATTATGVQFGFADGDRLYNIDMTEDAQLFPAGITAGKYTAYSDPNSAALTQFAAADLDTYFDNFTSGVGTGVVTAICDVTPAP